MSRLPPDSPSLAAAPSSVNAYPSMTSGPEKNASSLKSTNTVSTAPTTAAKLRSCATCRSRKVRCDKQSPCSNCRRANIACVLPSTDRPPRWARRLDRINNDAVTSNVDGKVMERLRNLEGLVKELSGQLEQAYAAASNSSGSSTQTPDAEHHHQKGTTSPTSTSSVQKQLGRLMVQDASRSRYVSSSFWSRINDELDGLKTDTQGLASNESDSSEDDISSEKTPSTQELERTPAERHAFLFRHNLSPSAPDLREFHPLPSQIPFLLDVFSENVNFFCQVVHMPTITKMVRDWRSGGMARLTPSNEALMFSIYYAAITSMEEDDIVTNFGSSKADLNLKYRLGLEHALAKADFLNAPDIVLVQAFGLFLSLVRRHDSPRFVWMMTGLLIRMAQYLGLHRDGTHFKDLTPYEIEMRRRVWSCICVLDLRASEDQGTDLAIASGSFDTKLPLNINNADIDPESNEIPRERVGLTDMSFVRVFLEMGVTMRQMTILSTTGGMASLEEQSRLLNKMYQTFEQGYFQYTTESDDIAHWVGVTITRLTMAKMTLITFLPVLFSSPSENFSEELRTKLLISAIEVAEYNHTLNSEHACRHWRWIYQTYTHWHAIVYLMIEISRRPWSPIVERAWVALQSVWLIPAEVPMDKNSRIIIPLRKLMDKARKHRYNELTRLHADPQAATKLEMEDQNIPLPSSSGPFANGSTVDIFRERWRQLVAVPQGPGDATHMSDITSKGAVDSLMHVNYGTQPTAKSTSAHILGSLSPDVTFESNYVGTSGQQTVKTPESARGTNTEPLTALNVTSELRPEDSTRSSHDALSSASAVWANGETVAAPGFVPWLWSDADPLANMSPNLNADSLVSNMDLDGEMNWYDWVESAKGMELA